SDRTQRPTSCRRHADATDHPGGTHPVCHMFATAPNGPLTSIRLFCEGLAVLCVESFLGGGFQQFGAVAQGLAQRLVAPPTIHHPVVARQQNGGHLSSTPLGGFGVDRPFHEVFHATGGEGVLDVGLSVAQDTGQQSGDRLHHDQARRLPTVEDEVADTEFFHRHVCCGCLRHPGFDALVASTAEDEGFFLGQP